MSLRAGIAGAVGVGGWLFTSRSSLTEVLVELFVIELKITFKVFDILEFARVEQRDVVACRSRRGWGLAHRDTSSDTSPINRNPVAVGRIRFTAIRVECPTRGFSALSRAVSTVQYANRPSTLSTRTVRPFSRRSLSAHT